MHNNNLEKKLKDISKIKLEKGEKDGIRQNLVTFINKNPIIQESSIDEAPISYPLFKRFSQMMFARPLVTALTLFILIGGGTGLAAQGSVPGDILYGYKINVNESFRYLMAFSDESKIKLYFEFAKERIDEAEKLLAKEEIKAEHSRWLLANFNENISRGYVYIEKLKGDSKSEVASDIISDFESYLEVDEELISIISKKVSEKSAPEVNLLIENIADALEFTAKKKEEKNTEIKHRKGGAKKFAEKKLKSAEDELSGALKFVEYKKSDLDSESQTEAEVDINSAIDLIHNGKKEFKNENFGEAFVIFQEAEEKIQKTELLLDGKIDLFGGNENNDNKEQANGKKEKDKERIGENEVDIINESDLNLNSHNLTPSL